MPDSGASQKFSQGVSDGPIIFDSHVPLVWHKSAHAAAKQNNMIGGTDKAHSYARMPCTRANGDVCAIRSQPVPPIKYFCLFSSSSSFPFVCAKVDRLVPKVWHKSKITEKRRVLRLVPASGTSHDHVGTGVNWKPPVDMRLNFRRINGGLTVD